MTDIIEDMRTAEQRRRYNATYYAAHRPEILAQKAAYQKNHRIEKAAYRRAHKSDRAVSYQSHKPEAFARKTGCDLVETRPWFDKDRTCWLCGEPGADELDHDHRTKRIRGWTHGSCNRAEGFIAKSPDPHCLLMTLDLEYR